MKHKTQKGELYIGIIISMGILMILTQAIVSLIFAAYDFVRFTRARTTARYIAQEQIETIRSMNYDDIGTLGGVPFGNLPQVENVLRNGQNYEINRSVIYVDDEFDGTAPTDTVPTDYKRVRINVSWGGVSPSNITLVTDVSPKGVETVVGGGTLSVLVLNANGEPIPLAQITISSSAVSPPVNLTQSTNVNGRLVLPGLPVCNNCYRIEVTKAGHSSERTYSVAEVANPTKPDATIIEAQVTELGFSIDQLSTLELTVVSNRADGFVPLSGQTINIQGSKAIGTTELDEPIFKYTEQFTTDSSGIVTIENLEWDVYGFAPSSTSGMMISSTKPLLPLQIEPNSSATLTLGLSPLTEHSEMITLISSSLNPIASASATLLNEEDFEQTIITGQEQDPDFGQVFFSDLIPGSYTLEATASGFQEISETVIVNGNGIPTFTMLEQ